MNLTRQRPTVFYFPGPPAAFRSADVPLLLGARVRATSPTASPPSTGVLTRLDADTIGVDTTPLTLTTVTRLELSSGQRTHPGSGLRVGFLVGAVIGAIVGSSAGNEDGEICTPISSFFGWDVIISAIVLLIFILREGTRVRVRYLWAPSLGTVLIGVSFGLPLFLALREDRLREPTEPPRSPVRPS